VAIEEQERPAPDVVGEGAEALEDSGHAALVIRPSGL
jgi:hypothetical protein